jgi:homoserine O-acetyltransferase
VSIRSDVLYPPAEQEELASLMPRGELLRMDSPHGHDAFLIDTDELSEGIRSFRNRVAAAGTG